MPEALLKRESFSFAKGVTNSDQSIPGGRVQPATTAAIDSRMMSTTKEGAVTIGA
jgi:hypothetical protein